tara:strand:- start:388 stop:603 length:216 start_codon:yes stop_codon:yes gene_type:complete
MTEQLTPRQRLLKALIAEKERTKSIRDRIEKLPEEDFNINHAQAMNGICASLVNNHEQLIGEYYKITKPVH